MFRPVSAVLATAVFIAATASAFAQSNPIPDSPVPGFGGRDTRPGNPGGSPSASGSDIGSNVGAGASASPLPDVRGMVFFGFPLHPAGNPSIERAAHLSAITVPMLFLQGSRDKLADPSLIAKVVDKIRGEIHLINQADHSFHVPKRLGRTDDEVINEIGNAVADWLKQHQSE